MRCAMRSNSVINSSTPGGGLFPPSGLEVVRSMASSRRMAVIDEGSAASTTESVSTMPINSSSERLDSCAASSSSDAIEYETLKARSDPRDVNDAAVAIEKTQCDDSGTLRRMVVEVRIMRALLAWQLTPSLPIRHFCVCSILESAPGRGGKMKGERARASHTYDGAVFGCMLPQLAHLQEGGDCSMAESIVLCQCVETAGAALRLEGAGVDHLIRGFASSNILKIQMKESGRYSVCLQAVDCRWRHTVGVVCFQSGVAVGVRCAGTGGIYRKLVRGANGYTQLLGTPRRCSIHKDALDAERRSLRRGIFATRVTKKEAETLGLDAYNALRMELAFFARGMAARCDIRQRIAGGTV